MKMSTAKSLIKDIIWKVDTPLTRGAVRGACATGLLSPVYAAYYKVGSPREILAGPFAGMSYFPVSAGSAWLPKILGTYESELHGPVEEACRQSPDLVVDIGSAEGYYAVGLARMLPAVRVYCFDTDARANTCMMRNARMNGVEGRIVPGGFCTPERLEALLAVAESPLLICDCEGGETELLDLDRAPSLRRATVLVEVHDFFDSDKIGRLIRGRFAGSHDIERVPIVARKPEEMPAECLAKLTVAEAQAALSEARPPASGWLVLRPKGRAQG
ncbi:hypothetical protein EP7_002926 [Isosphaeraceae bacterium EP7]